MAQDLHQVPPNLEVWKVGNQYYLVRRVVEFGDPPIFLYWEVNPDDVEAIGITKPDYTFQGPAVFNRTGALFQGNSRELVNTEIDPLESILNDYETEVRVKPWLADPEILALWIGAAEEGRAMTDSELQGTEWWRTHSSSERAWLSLNASDPETANQLIADNRRRVADMLSQAGIDNANEELINLISDNWTMGKWSEAYATDQVRLLADPYLRGDLDPDLQSYRDSGTLDTTRAREDEVRNAVSRWLGPSLAQYYTDDFYGQWASRLRNNPDAMLELEDYLRKQFQTHINIMRNGERVYGDDANLTYEDVAGPWRGVYQQIWGQIPDETSDLFLRIVRLNDLGTAQRLLREEGMSEGNSQVVNDFLQGINSSFGGQIRRADPAIV